MTIDFERMPVGERGWTAFLEWVQALDDRYERHYLELKTAIDLTAKADRHKVAKFILAASNRDQSKAAKYFDGRALMVLGLGDSEPRGVGPFEMEELEAEVVKFIGVEGPQWDLHRIPLGNRRDIVVIIVDPPTGRIWPSLRDGNKLADGDIYIRVDGASRKAKGPEVQAMLRRSLVSPRALDVDVALNGAATVIRIDRGDLRALGRNIAQSLMADHEQATTGPYAKFSSAAATETSVSRRVPSPGRTV